MWFIWRKKHLEVLREALQKAEQTKAELRAEIVEDLWKRFKDNADYEVEQRVSRHMRAYVAALPDETALRGNASKAVSLANKTIDSVVQSLDSIPREMRAIHQSHGELRSRIEALEKQLAPTGEP